MAYYDWLWDTKRGILVRKLISVLAPILAFLATLWVINQTETRFFPVITKWSLDYIERDGDHLHMGGRMEKTRACELINTSVVAVPKNPLLPKVLIYQIGPTEIVGSNMPMGYHTWGPWDMKIPKAFIQHKEHIAAVQIVGHHRCHALWLQETIYGTVPVERIPA